MHVRHLELMYLTLIAEHLPLCGSVKNVLVLSKTTQNFQAYSKGTQRNHVQTKCVDALT